MMKFFSSFSTWFYCLPIPDILFIASAAVLFFLIFKDRYHHCRWWNPCMFAAFILFSAAALVSTLHRQSGASAANPLLIPFYSYWTVLTGGNKEILRSNFMNVVLFFPAGLFAAAFLPHRWSRRTRILLVVAVLVTVSAGVEYLQFLHALGNPETDDVIHNACGAVLGSFFGTAVLPKDDSIK